MEGVSLESIQKLRILVVGDVMIDEYWIGSADRISPEAPVPVVKIQEQNFFLGGAANVAKNLCQLGAQVTIAGFIGGDTSGATLSGMLGCLNIVSALSTLSAWQTTTKIRILAKNHQAIRMDFEAPPPIAAVKEAVDKWTRLLEQHDILVLSDYAKGGLAVCESLVERARALGLPVIVDPKGEDWSRYRGVQLLTPNREELRSVIGQWVDRQELKEKVDTLRKELMIGAVLLTESEDGMSLFDEGTTEHLAAEVAGVVDVTGAGDTVVSILAVCIGCGEDNITAMHWANRAAGISVLHTATYAPTFKEVFVT